MVTVYRRRSPNAASTEGCDHRAPGPTRRGQHGGAPLPTGAGAGLHPAGAEGAPARPRHRSTDARGTSPARSMYRRNRSHCRPGAGLGKCQPGAGAPVECINRTLTGVPQEAIPDSGGEGNSGSRSRGARLRLTCTIRVEVRGFEPLLGVLTREHVAEESDPWSNCGAQWSATGQSAEVMGLRSNPFDPRSVNYRRTGPRASLTTVSRWAAGSHPQLSPASAAITVRSTFLAAARSPGTRFATSSPFRDSTTLTTASAYD